MARPIRPFGATRLNRMVCWSVRMARTLAFAGKRGNRSGRKETADHVLCEPCRAKRLGVEAAPGALDLGQDVLAAPDHGREQCPCALNFLGDHVSDHDVVEEGRTP